MKKNKISPYEIWKNRKSNISYFKVWGCLTYCKNIDPKRTKLGHRGIKCAFMAYAFNSKAYRLLNLETDVIIKSRDMEFFENIIVVRKSENDNKDISIFRSSPEETSKKDVEIESRRSKRTSRRSKRTRKEKNLGSDEINPQLIYFYLVEGDRNEVVRTIPFVLQVESDPKTYKEAMQSRDCMF